MMLFILKLQILLNSIGFQPLPDSLSPELSGYKISECEQAQTSHDFLFYANLTNHELQIKLGAYLNCIVDPKSPLTFEFKNDTLNLLIPEYKEVNDTIIKKTDSTNKITIRHGTSRTACDCFYTIHAGFRNCAETPKIIQLNGNTMQIRSETIKKKK